jgi:molybdopterin-guanine dinucleotide biosynthesis protein A
MKIAGLILAGGQGSRLGGVDKAFLVLAGQPLLAHALAVLAPQTDMLAISANGDPARFAAFPFPILADTHEGRGPLAGIAVGLAWAARAGADHLASLPVDTPFAPANLVARLSPGPSVAVYEGRQHHLVALWPVAFLPALEDVLAQPGRYKVRDALSLAAARQVDVPAAADPFLNLNTPADIEAAETRALSPRAE